MHLPGWPGGDPGALSSASDAWGDLEDAWLASIHACNVTTFQLESSWSGDAATKWGAVWKGFAVDKLKEIHEINSVSDQVDQYADALSDAHKKYEHAVAIAAASIAVGLGLSFLTLGASDAVAAAETATQVGIISILMADLSAVLSAIGGVIGVSCEVLAGALISGTITFAVGVGAESAESEWNDGEWDVDWTTVTEESIFSVFGGLIGGTVLGDAPKMPTRILVGASVAGGTNLTNQVVDHEIDGTDIDLGDVFKETLVGGVEGSLEGWHADKVDAAGGTDGSGADPITPEPEPADPINDPDPDNPTLADPPTLNDPPTVTDPIPDGPVSGQGPQPPDSGARSVTGGQHFPADPVAPPQPQRVG